MTIYFGEALSLFIILRCRRAPDLDSILDVAAVWMLHCDVRGFSCPKLIYV